MKVLGRIPMIGSIIIGDGEARLLTHNGVRPSLPYQGIARRALATNPITYDKEIDVSALIVKSRRFNVIDRGSGNNKR